MLAVQRELGSISEALKNAESYRAEVLARLDKANGTINELTQRLSDKIDDQNFKIDDLKGSLINVDQSVKSSSAQLTAMATEKCGTRLDKIETILKDYPHIESEVMFWRRLLGGTFKTFWKLIALLVGSGGIGALVIKFWPFH
jgi:chromosome segregation ATPase